MTRASMNRRGLLRGSAGMTLVAVGGMVEMTGGCSAAVSEAYAPWDLWNSPAARGTPLALAAAAVLAANPHDSQPWLFHLREDAIEVFAYTSRNLGAMDPFLREMHIGLGCALENIALAAPANGLRAEIQAVPGALDRLGDRGGPVHAASVRLTRPAQPDPVSPLYAAIPHRHTNRYAYDRAKAPSAAWRAAMSGLVDGPDVRLILFPGVAGRAAYDACVIEATTAIIADAPMIADSDRWLRTTPAQIEKYRSGPTLETAGLSPMTVALARTLPTPAKVQHGAWLSHTREQLSTAPLAGFIAVRELYGRAGALAAGRAWQRLHLAATAAGVAVQPMNQPMEIVDRDRQLGRGPAWAQRLAALTAQEGWRPTFSFRMGISARPAPPSPRRSLSDALIA